MSAFHVRVIDGGKIVLPAALRRKHGFEVGKTLVVEDTSGGVTIRSLDDAVAAAQAIMARVAPPDRVLSDELIAERRRRVTERYGLDASALLCLIRNEPGADAVRAALSESSIGAVNLSEVIAKMADLGIDADLI